MSESDVPGAVPALGSFSRGENRSFWFEAFPLVLSTPRQVVLQSWVVGNSVTVPYSEKGAAGGDTCSWDKEPESWRCEKSLCSSEQASLTLQASVSPVVFKILFSFVILKHEGFQASEEAAGQEQQLPEAGSGE